MYNKINTPSITDLYTRLKIAKMGNFMLFFFYHESKKKKIPYCIKGFPERLPSPSDDTNIIEATADTHTAQEWPLFTFSGKTS